MDNDYKYGVYVFKRGRRKAFLGDLYDYRVAQLAKYGMSVLRSFEEGFWTGELKTEHSEYLVGWNACDLSDGQSRPNNGQWGKLLEFTYSICER